jgi:LAO/AO transport system kinase
VTVVEPPTPAALLARAQQGDRGALARLITLVERADAAADDVDAITFPSTGRAHVVGITGAPGTGKSTITGRLAARLGGDGRSVAVLAVDPSSPLSGGAILGDRIRMDEVAGEPSVFIRSMATRGSTDGLALAVPGAVRVLDAAGFETVVVETAGVGQVEVAVTGAADTVVVVVTPGWGDAIQANKAGLLELADVFVVNKAEQAGAAACARDLERMLDLGTPSADRGSARPRVVCTTATSGAGIDDLAAALDDHLALLRGSGALATRRAMNLRAETSRRAIAQFARRLDELSATPAGRRILDDVAARRTPPWIAARALLRSHGNSPVRPSPKDGAS